MKNITMMLVSLIVFLFQFQPAFAQPLPKGAWVAQPSGSDRIMVFWTDYTNWKTRRSLQAEFDETGKMYRMSLFGGSVDNGTQFEYSFPAEEKSSKVFKDLTVWKKFAENAMKEFIFVTKDAYIEKTPFVFIGRSVVIDNWEVSEGWQTLIFKKGDRLLSVAVKDWVGQQPKEVGELVIVGQTVCGDCFFPAEELKKGGYTVTIEVAGKIKEKTGKEISTLRE